MRARWWWLHLVGGAALAVAYLLADHLFADGELVRLGLYQAVACSTVVVVLVGTRRQTAATRLPWLVLALGQALWATGDGVWAYLSVVHHAEPHPSPADAFYLAAYPLLGACLVLLGRHRPLDGSGLVDSAIVTVSFGLPTWILLAGPVLDGRSQGLTTVLVGVAYPVGDVLLLALLVRLSTSGGARTPSFRLLVAGAVVLPVADVLSSAVPADGPLTDLFSVLWMASYLLWGAAALHPSADRVSAAGSDPVGALPPVRLALLAVAILVAPGSLALQLLGGDVAHGWPVVVCTVLLVLLGVVRVHLGESAQARSVRQRDQLQVDLEHQASHDALTGLPHRTTLLHLTEAALDRARRSGTGTGLLLLDVDRFKHVNDSHGQRVGDHVLQAVATHLLGCVREGDVVGRLGGDEFVVLVEDVDGEGVLLDLARRLTTVELDADGRHLALTTSTGVAVAVAGRATAGELLHHAEVAASRAHDAGGARAWAFDEDLRFELQEQARLEAAVRAGLGAGEFVLHYQPVVDVATLAVTGYEALIRWERPGHGRVPPDSFIPVAERSALICDVGRWVLDQACAQLAAWADRDTTVAVNLSGRHLAHPGVVDEVLDALRVAGVPARRLVVEVTETVVLDDAAVGVNLRALREAGVAVSLDDFGTGYTSLGQLRDLPVSTLKIDKSFVSAATGSEAELVGLLVHAAHAFGLDVVAEGVERPDQLEMLRGLGCDQAQGYLFSRPLPAEELPAGVPAGVTAGVTAGPR